MIISCDFVLFEEFIELPQEDGGHFLPTDIGCLGVDQAALTCVGAKLELSDETWPSAGRDTGLGANKVLVK